MSKAKELAERLRSCGEFTRIGAAHDAVALLLSQENRIAELEKALEPFAAIPPTILEVEELTLGRTRPAREAPFYWVVIGTPNRVSFTGDDLRRARSALTPSSPGEEG